MTTVDDAVLTPRVRTTLRRATFWIGAVIVVLLVAIVTALSFGRGVGGTPLSPSNPAPQGAMAVAEVLRDQGVDVIETSSLDDTVDAITDPERTTVFVIDTGYLDSTQWTDLVGSASRVIVASPSFSVLQDLVPEVAQAGAASGPYDPGCDLPLLQRAGTVSGPGDTYRIVDDEADAITCLETDGDRAAFVQLLWDDTELTILGATGALTNDAVMHDGNAAFALGLLGEFETLVWYLPSVADLAADEVPVTMGDLTPPWVTPVLVLLVLTFVAAAVWRGRRMGPLVVENLPVTVHSSETMHGRARLYERSSARLRALDALRVGAIDRLASSTGLPRAADVGEVVIAVAALTGRPAGEVRALLLDAVPVTDSDLVRLSDELLELETQVKKTTEREW